MSQIVERRYWGIWFTKSKGWLEGGDGILYFPHKAIAEAVLSRMPHNSGPFLEQDLVVREFISEEE